LKAAKGVDPFPGHRDFPAFVYWIETIKLVINNRKSECIFKSNFKIKRTEKFAERYGKLEGRGGVDFFL
jgi:hypothetical protein